jgi:hypothetical protein
MTSFVMLPVTAPFEQRAPGEAVWLSLFPKLAALEVATTLFRQTVLVKAVRTATHRHFCPSIIEMF